MQSILGDPAAFLEKKRCLKFILEHMKILEQLVVPSLFYIRWVVLLWQACHWKNDYKKCLYIERASNFFGNVFLFLKSAFFKFLRPRLFFRDKTMLLLCSNTFHIHVTLIGVFHFHSAVARNTFRICSHLWLYWLMYFVSPSFRSMLDLGSCSCHS